ncbi:response regulator transcription factor [Pseudoflavonifractor phocaeensis]|uniref:response regulator transcription factor n=1 Tax=Pseudoflavonifractor phocaeensis TaxID=1870988 RepID=UPI001956766D|nr:response regulator transcription factor [Pseudoflavonifractor phocaeensis]MBM6887381.1 response regulator transcription factor [Pseudoflavonifractor phocaeensis]
MNHIFLLEDDETLGRGIAMALTGPEVSVACRPTLAQAREALAEEQFDLLILDINLPDGSSLDLLRQVRAEGDATPVILLTANDLELDEVTGLEAGADDYITKPFSLAVLRARVNTQLRRGAPNVSRTLSIGPFTFDFDRMDFRRDGTAVELSKTEQRLLRVLVENRGHAVPRATLVDRVWTDGAEFVEENALSVTVKRLRSKLESDPSKPEYLKTVYGIGYTWAVKS